MPYTPIIEQDLWKQIQSTLYGDYRTRFERRVDRDFQEANNDNRSDLHQRLRVGFNVNLTKKVAANVQYQYAHTLTWSKAKNFSDENSDLFVANAQFKEDAGTFTVGRQRINLGSERLVGSLEWVNAGRSYDAARFENKTWDVFFGRIGVQNVRPRYVRLAAASNKNALGTTSLIFKHDKTTAGNVDLTTLAHAYRKQFRNYELDAEGALQFGRNAGKDQEAWAIHAQANVPLDSKTKVSLEVNSASGGSSGNTIRTFDNLYPTNHKFYGLMDLHAWKNVDMLALGLTHSPSKSIDVKARAASSRLHDAKDAWYGAAGGPNRHSGGPFIDPTGNSGKEIGEEVDLEVVWRRNPKQALSAGFGVFFPGKFVKKEAGDDRQQVFGFVMFSLKT